MTLNRVIHPRMRPPMPDAGGVVPWEGGDTIPSLACEMAGTVAIPGGVRTRGWLPLIRVGQSLPL